ncbi:MAG: CotH kinase family protein [Methanobrevibacter sp.]|nr:CotH kinase family protein [Methanobrevibacter sp.]
MAFLVVFLGSYLLENWSLKRALVRVEGDAVSFSMGSGVYDHTLGIELNYDFELPFGTEIFYTLNGDDPRTAGKKYKEKINLEEIAGELKVYPLSATVCYKQQCGEVYERTYIVDKDYKNRLGIDLISITSSHKGLYDYEKGILVKGKTYDEAKKNNPDAVYVMGNYSRRGDEWIRDAHVTRFDKNAKLLWDQDVGIGVSGGTSAALTPKSLKLYANEKKGYTEKLEMAFNENGEKSKIAFVDEHNTLRLRSGSQDMLSANIRSSVISRLARQSGFDGYTDTHRTVVFLNGELYGVFDMQESYSNSFLAKRFSLTKTDKIQKNKGSEKAVLEQAEIRNLFDTNLNDKENREKLEAAVDMENYLKYYALQILWNNTDWPWNGVEIWRYTGKEEDDNVYSDGRWRFLIYDVDLAYFSYSRSFFGGDNVFTLEYLMEKKAQGEDSLFANVMESEYYKRRFCEIVNTLMRTTFRSENVLAIVDSEAQKIRIAENFIGRGKVFEQEFWSMKRQIANMSKKLENGFRKYFDYDIFEERVVDSPKWSADGLAILEMAPKGGADWMKFINMGKEKIYLGDYYISDNPEQLKKYELPKIWLGTGETILINGKNNFYRVGEYICNFNLSEGETLYLTLGEEIVDKFYVPRMSKDETVGRDLNTGERVFYYDASKKRRDVI